MPFISKPDLHISWCLLSMILTFERLESHRLFNTSFHISLLALLVARASWPKAYQSIDNNPFSLWL